MVENKSFCLFNPAPISQNPSYQLMLIPQVSHWTMQTLIVSQITYWTVLTQLMMGDGKRQRRTLTCYIGSHYIQLDGVVPIVNDNIGD